MAGSKRTAGVWRRYSTRLVGGVLLMAVPVMAIIVVVLTQVASSRLRSNAFTVLRNEAALVAHQVEAHIADLGGDLTLIGGAVADIPPGPPLDAKLNQLWRLDPQFQALLLVAPDGTIIASTPGAARPRQPRGARLVPHCRPRNAGLERNRQAGRQHRPLPGAAHR